MSASRVRQVACPSCAAPLAWRDDRHSLRCPACGSRCVLAGVDAAPRSRVRPRVSRDEAVSLVRRSLARWPVRDGTAERAAVVAADLFLVPLAEFEAVRAGTVLRNRGTRIERSGRVDWSQGRRRFLDDAGNEIAEHDYYRQRTVEDIDTSVVLLEHRACRLAGGPRDWGLQAIDPSEAFDDPDLESDAPGAARTPAHVLEPDWGAEQAREELERSAAALGRPDLDLLAVEVRYLFVPVWAVRIRVDGHPYLFVVDAVRARVLTGRAPEAPQRGALFLVLAAAYVGFPVGKLVAAAFSSGGDDLGRAWLAAAGFAAHLGVFALVLAALALVPVAWAWGEFRFRGEVVFEPAGVRVVKSSRPARTFLERVIDRMLQAGESWVDAAGNHGDTWWDRP